MIYAIQVLSREETHVVRLALKLLDSHILNRCYLPYREMLKKYGAKWHKVREILFPGYVFIETDDPLELYLQLKRVPKLTKMLYDYDDQHTFFIDLLEEDIRFMQHVITPEGYLGLSTIKVISPQEFEILEGPLLELTDQILKINLHQRYANVRMKFLGKEADVHFGISILGTDE